MYIILLKEEFLYNVRKVKNTVNISQTAEEISKHYKCIWKGIYIPLFPIDFNFIIIFFFLTVSMFLGEVIMTWWLFIIIFNLKSIFQHFTHCLHSRLHGKVGRSGDSNSRTDPRGTHAWTPGHYRPHRVTFEQTWYNLQERICSPSFGRWYS